MADEDESLEILLNKATNISRREEDWEFINAFCDQVNKELEGPQVAIRLIAHKIQSPQEREALYALTTLEACVKNCGKRFHAEIGKFRFLNEMIKVVSPKYLGNKTTEKIKKRCIELLYSWSKGLPHESKVEEAYKMLKQQGIVKEDPVYLDKEAVKTPPPPPRVATFEDEEKSRLLGKLLKSKNPQDLQAANRLIKNMVKQDEEKTEKVSRRINELQTIENNIKLLQEMLQHFNSTSSSAEKDMMKELYDTLERLRPNLFRLASDTDEKDNNGIADILKTNDEVMKVMALYKSKVDGVTEENGKTQNGDQANASSLLDFTFEQNSSNPDSSQINDPSNDILDKELSALDLKQENDKPDSLLGDLDEIFAASNLANKEPTPSAVPVVNQMFPVTNTQTTFPPMNQPIRAPLPNYNLEQPFNPVMSQSPQIPGTMNSLQSVSLFSSTDTNTNNKPKALQPQQQKALNDLDLLGQNLLQQSLPKDIKIQPQEPSELDVDLYVFHRETQSLTLNQMAAKSTSASIPNSVTGATGVIGPAVISQSPAGMSPQVLSLTDVFVPLETIQPGSDTPVNAYDKSGLKIVIHMAKNKPREDVSVMVVSTISTNTNAVKSFVFQAAVPKVMKVKLQPPSATDLPAYNPILPPAAITQVMLLANPQKEKIRLKFKITYLLNEASCSDVGEVDSFSV